MASARPIAPAARRAAIVQDCVPAAGLVRACERAFAEGDPVDGRAICG